MWDWQINYGIYWNYFSSLLSHILYDAWHFICDVILLNYVWIPICQIGPPKLLIWVIIFDQHFLAAVPVIGIVDAAASSQQSTTSLSTTILLPPWADSNPNPNPNLHPPTTTSLAFSCIHNHIFEIMMALIFNVYYVRFYDFFSNINKFLDNGKAFLTILSSVNMKSCECLE